MVAALRKRNIVASALAFSLLAFLAHGSAFVYQSQHSSVKKKAVTADSNWHYITKTNEMTSEKEYTALDTGKGMLQFKFPYNGGSKLIFGLVYKGGENLAGLQITKGQFNVNILKSTYVLIRFDTAQPEYYEISRPTNSSYNVVFISDADKIIAKLKKAKKMIVQVSFFNEPDAVVKFNVAGLKWEHKDRKEEKPVSAAKETKAGGWEYDAGVDKMTSAHYYLADVKAKDKMDFDFPYDGGAEAYFYVRNIDSAQDILLKITEGRFDYNYFDDTYVRIRLDDAKPLYYKVTKPDGFTDGKILFIPFADSLINKLKTTKKMLVEAAFVGNGTRIMEYNTEGLVWNHPLRKKVSRKISSGSAKTKKHDDYSNIFDTIFKSPSVKTTVSYGSYSTSDSKGSSNVEISVGGSGSKGHNSGSASTGGFTLLHTKENIDRQNDVVTLTCTCRNNSSEESTVTLKASFMNAEGKVIAVKKVSLSCSGNVDLNTDISVSGISNNYKTFKVEVQ